MRRSDWQEDSTRANMAALASSFGMGRACYESVSIEQRMQARYERRERKRNSDAGFASTQHPDLEELGLSCIPTADEDFTISHGTFAAPALLEKARNPRRKAPSMTV